MAQELRQPSTNSSQTAPGKDLKSRAGSNFRKVREELARLGFDLCRLASSSAPAEFPQPDCLLPHEVEEFRERHTLEESRMAHLGTCADCHAMLVASSPEPELLKAFLSGPLPPSTGEGIR